ncbi:MAG: hypothetical protein ABI767_04995 [Rhodanobacter sp.]
MSDDLRHLVTLLNTVESEDDPRYVSELEQLRGRSSEVVAEARRLLSATSGHATDNFSLRHSVVLAVAALRDPGALDLLSEVALNPQPLPPVEEPLSSGLFESHPEHRLNSETVVQATIVALDAVDGIESLAAEGHVDALDALVKASGASSNAVRAAALTALGARSEWREHRDRAAASLPDDLGHLAHLSRKSVAEVPQIRDPRTTLLGSGTATTRAPGLDDDSGLRRTRVPGAPRAGRS